VAIGGFARAGALSTAGGGCGVGVAGLAAARSTTCRRETRPSICSACRRTTLSSAATRRRVRRADTHPAMGRMNGIDSRNRPRRAYSNAAHLRPACRYFLCLMSFSMTGWFA
jgi:hypothetical protein